VVLHPNRRKAYLDRNWRVEWRKPALKSAKKLWETYRKKVSVPTISVKPPRTSAGKEPKDLSVFERIGRKLDNEKAVSKDEFDDYVGGEPAPIDTSPLQWWCQNLQRERWPRLSLMAIDILSIPAMSAEPERIFSGGRRTISWDRAQLGAASVEMLECLKHWERSSILDI
jgi:hypothetical protein